MGVKFRYATCLNLIAPDQGSLNLDLESKSSPCFQFTQSNSLVITDSDWPQRLHAWFPNKRTLENQQGLDFEDRGMNSHSIDSSHTHIFFQEILTITPTLYETQQIGLVRGQQGVFAHDQFLINFISLLLHYCVTPLAAVHSLVALCCLIYSRPAPMFSTRLPALSYVITVATDYCSLSKYHTAFCL